MMLVIVFCGLVWCYSSVLMIGISRLLISRL